jgi:hypothetical protein
MYIALSMQQLAGGVDVICLTAPAGPCRWPSLTQQCPSAWPYGPLSCKQQQKECEQQQMQCAGRSSWLREEEGDYVLVCASFLQASKSKQQQRECEQQHMTLKLFNRGEVANT